MAPAALFAHGRHHGLHAGDGAEEIGFEQFAQCSRLHIGDRVADAHARVIHPHIHAIEVLQRQRQRSANIFAVANIAGHGKCAAGVANPVAGGLRAAGIARKQYYAGSCIGKNLGDRLPNSHGSPGHNHDFPVHLHGDPCIAASAASQTTSSSQLSALSSQ
jgi:hypothetical protein